MSTDACWILAKTFRALFSPDEIVGIYASDREAQLAADEDDALLFAGPWIRTVYSYCWPAYRAALPRGRGAAWIIRVSPELAAMTELAGELWGLDSGPDAAPSLR